MKHKSEKKSYRLKRLNRDNLPHFARLAFQLIKQWFDTKRAYFLARWWRVILGNGGTFVGKIYFRRAPNGTIKIGENCRFLSSFSSNLHGINRPCMLTTLCYGAEIQIGNDTGMSGTVIAATTKVTIGSRVFCGANTTITDTDSHSLDYRDRHPRIFRSQEKDWDEPVNSKPITIEDDVFLGMNVTVLKGVTIGRGTVVGAGSIVAKSLPPFVIAAGQPAKPVASLIDLFPGIEENDTHPSCSI
jgi:acetyltransferase-like isoleucine patch superfamily enzyme